MTRRSRSGKRNRLEGDGPSKDRFGYLGVTSGTPNATQNVSIPMWLPWIVLPVLTVFLFREFIFSNDMLLGYDTLGLGYVARAFFAERLAVGDFPLWAPQILGGIPFLEALAGGDSLYPTSLLYFVVEPYRALGWKLVLHILCGGFFMMGWTRSLGLGRPASLLAGIAWLLAPVIVTLVLPGNDGKLMVATLAPLVFWATQSVFSNPGPRSVAGLAAAVGVTCLTTQFQTSYFLFLAVGAFALMRAWGTVHGDGKGKGIPAAGKLFGLFLGASLLGGAIASMQLVPAAQYATNASRRTRTTTSASPAEAIAYSSSFSLHPEELLSLAIPEFIGNDAADADWGRGTYWGRNGLKLNHEYLGISVLLLAALALVYQTTRRRERRFFAGLCAVALLFALGTHTPLWRIFYEVIPGIRLFRVPSLAAFLVSFSVTTLFAMAVDDLLSDPVNPDWKESARGKTLVGFMGLLVLGLILQATGLLTSLWTALIHPSIAPQKAAILANAAPFITKGFFFALLIAGAVATLVWAHGSRRIPSAALVGLLALVVTVDLVRIDAPFIQTLDFHTWAAPDANIQTLQALKEGGEPFRVADLRNAQNVDLAMFGIDIVAGHHPNDLSRYRDLLGLEGSQAGGANLSNPNVLRMLSTQYLVWPEGQAGGPPFPGATPLSQVQGPAGLESIYAYPGLGRAWMVHSAKVVEDDDVALVEILSQEFDPEREAILAGGTGFAAADGESPQEARITWSQFDPDNRKLTVETTQPGFLVVSENWFPGWMATVDGQSEVVQRVNLTLQGVALPAGRHEVELRFTAPTVTRWLPVSLAALVLTLLLAVAPVVLRRND